MTPNEYYKITGFPNLDTAKARLGTGQTVTAHAQLTDGRNASVIFYISGMVHERGPTWWVQLRSPRDGTPQNPMKMEGTITFPHRGRRTGEVWADATRLGRNKILAAHNAAGQDVVEYKVRLRKWVGAPEVLTPHMYIENIRCSQVLLDRNRPTHFFMRPTDDEPRQVHDACRMPLELRWIESIKIDYQMMVD